MGCNCQSNTAKDLRTKLHTSAVPETPMVITHTLEPEPVKPVEKTTCTVCKGELISRIERIRHKWVAVKWCPVCEVRYVL